MLYKLFKNKREFFLNDKKHRRQFFFIASFWSMIFSVPYIYKKEREYSIANRYHRPAIEFSIKYLIWFYGSVILPIPVGLCSIMFALNVGTKYLNLPIHDTYARLPIQCKN